MSDRLRDDFVVDMTSGGLKMRRSKNNGNRSARRINAQRNTLLQENLTQAGIWKLAA